MLQIREISCVLSPDRPVHSHVDYDTLDSIYVYMYMCMYYLFIVYFYMYTCMQVCTFL